YVEPLIPPAKTGGGKRRTGMRAVMNGVMYILSTGCQWRYLPKDFPPRSTVHDYFTWWNCDGTLDRIHHALYVECREKLEREASPTARIKSICHRRLRDIAGFDAPTAAWSRAQGRWRRTWSGARIALCCKCAYRSKRRDWAHSI